VAVVAAGLVLAVAAPAAAHNYVVASTPAAGEVVTTLPETWAIETSDSLLYGGNDEVFGLWARDADGLYYGDGCVDVTGREMTAQAVIGAAGSYTLVFQFVSADGHPLSDEIPFEWAPEGEHEAASGSVEPPRCGITAPAPDPDRGDAADAGIPADAWWIGGAVLAVAGGVVGAVLLGRRGGASGRSTGDGGT